MKKILALVLALAMTVTMCAVFVSAEGGDPVAIKGISFKSEVDGVVNAVPRGSSTSIDVLIDGDTVSDANDHQNTGIVLFQNTHCETADEYPNFDLILELEDAAIVNGGAISFYNQGIAMIGTPKDRLVTIEYSDDGVDYIYAEEIVLDCIDSNDDWEKNNGAIVNETVEFSLTTPINAKYVKLTFAYGDSPWADSKPVWEWMGMTEISLDAVEAGGPVVEDPSEEPSVEPSEEPSAPAPVVVPVTGNLAAGKSYTADDLFRAGGAEVGWGWSDTADIAYPDEDGKTLTDSVRSNGEADYRDTAWIGFNTSTPSTTENGYAWMNVDLSDKADLDKFVLYIGGKGLGGGISLPEKVEFFVSDDNENWTSVGEAVIPEDDGTLVEGAAVLELDKAVSGRYVRVEVSREKGWMFVSELEVYGTQEVVVTPSSNPGTEPTSDSGIVALAVIASLAVAGAVIVKKSR